MHSLCRMHEERRRAKAGQRRGNLRADMARLSHTSQDHLAPAVQNQLHDLLKLRSYRIPGFFKCLNFLVKDFLCLISDAELCLHIVSFRL